MKNSTNRYIATILAIALSWPMAIYAQFGGGSGTIGDPYLVATATHLNNVRTQLGSHFIQTSNIDLDISPYNTGDGWEPIGTSSAKFTGNYNGQGYTVSGLFINRGLTDEIGLFGYISGTAVLSRIGVVEVIVTGKNNVAAVAGYSEGTVDQCYSTGIVEGTQNAGGLVGYSYGLGGGDIGAITNSYSLAYVRASSIRAGGLVAYSYYGTITNCYAAGGVSAPGNSGGLIGTVTAGTVTNSYWNSETSAQVSSAAGSGITTAEMQLASSFTGWDFGSIWAINSGTSYPYLQSNQQLPAPGPNPFEVSSIQDLDNIRNLMHGHYILTKNLDFNEDSSYDPVGGWEAFKTSVTTGEGFAPIGISTSQFNGLLDGNGYAISNLYINRPATDNIALIGYSNGAGEVRNLGVIDVNITGDIYVGAIVGYCHGIVSTSYSTGIVEAFQNAGGLVGMIDGLTASNPARIQNCYSQAYARASSTRAGGLAAYNYYGEIINCYSTGGVSAPGNSGGLVGTSTAGSTTDSYWNSETSAQVGSAGGDALTMAHMMQASSISGWDFGDTWAINPGSSYPYLQDNQQIPPPAPNPLEVSSIQDLDNIRNFMHGHYILTKNLDFNEDSSYDPISGWEAFKTLVTTGDGFAPIGVSLSQFNGMLDGNGYAINNLYINRPATDNIALIGYSNGAGEVRNLGVINVNVTGKNYVAAIVGYCHGIVSTSYSTGIVEAFQNAGGLVGMIDGLTASNPARIQNCYSQAYARASSTRAGGLTAYNYYGEIINSYSTGGVSAPGNSGGLVGTSTAGSTFNSYWSSETSAQVGSAGGDALTMAQMQQASSFSGWDFGDTWAINPGSSYPYLQDNQQIPPPAPNPLEVSSIQDLDNIRNFMHGHYILTKNLDFNEDSSYDPISGWEAFKILVTTGDGFAPIGVSSSQFNGMLDGNGYAINNLYINRPATDNIALIGYSNGAGEVRNLGVINVNVTGKNYVAAIVGYCHGIVSTSYSTGIVEAFQNAGGLVGMIDGLTASNPARIQNCYSQAYARASSTRAGGLVAYNYYGEIINSYSTGGVSAPGNSGGLVGTSTAASTTNSYWNSETSAQVGSAGGNGLTMAQMQQASSFSGWDFVNIWAIVAGSSYPYLQDNQQVPPPAPNPIEVSSIQDLDNIRNFMHGHYILTKNLDFNDDGSYDPVGGWETFKTSVTSGLGFAPIGVTASRFNGLLDGNGFAISNLYINRPTTDDIGLIGYSNGAGEVRNLGVTDVNITGRYYVGAITGYCHGTIASSYSTGEVNAFQSAGGLVGINNGIVATDPGLIINCYSLANAHASSSRAGGLSAWNYYAEIINCYSAGAVSAPGSAGGLVGTSTVATTTNSYWNLETAAVISSDGGTALTTWEMKLESSFSNWDFDDIWSIVEKSTYPYLTDNIQSPLPGPTPIEIYTIQDLDNTRNNLKAHYILMNDLDFEDDNSYEQVGNWEDFKTDMTTGEGFLPIGNSSNLFHGFFDGNGFVIENLFINRPATSHIGLFGATSPAGRISRTSILNADITAGRYVGAVVGYNNGTILTSFSTGSITNTATGDAGGIAGMNDGLGTSIGLISDSYSRASVTGLTRVGGLVGWNYYALIMNSYSTGAVSGSSSVGGLVGNATAATTLNSYWDTQTSGRPTSVGGLGRTTAEMTSPHDANTFDTWNFIHLWADDAAYSKNDGYPFFGFPSEYSSPNLVIEDGNSACFDSEDKIVLAGSGTNFLLESGASLELAAVNSITLKDGFRAHAGSYGHFFIDPNSDFCNPPNLLSIQEESVIEPIQEIAKGKSTKLYPNPTSGMFTLDLIGYDDEVPTVVEIFGTLGERVFTNNLGVETTLHFNLEDRPVGIYIVRILNGNDVSVHKIMKQ